MVYSNKTVDRFMVFVGAVVCLLVVFGTVAPYFIHVPTDGNQRLIDQQQTMLQTVFIALASYLWGSSVGRREVSRDSTIVIPPPSTVQSIAEEEPAIKS